MRNTYKNISGTGLASTWVINGPGVISGMYVNSTTAGTVKLYDYSSATGTAISGTITPAIGYHNLGSLSCSTGCFASLGGTIDVTFHVLSAE
jgi:hypothetical protein